MIQRAILLSIVAMLSSQASAQSLTDLNSALSINNKAQMIRNIQPLPYTGKDIVLPTIDNININNTVIC